MRTLPAGGYIHRRSPIHRLDARVKLCVFVVGVVAVLLCDEWWKYIPVVAVFAAIGALTKLKPFELLMPLKRIWIFLVVIFAMNALFFGAEGEPFFRLGPLAPSLQGIEQGGHIAVNVALVLVWAGMLTMTTPPIAITSALEFFFKPLAFIGVPVKTLSLIISVAVQFIPTLLEETDTIRKAQTARGARFESRNLLRRAQAVIPLVIPVFVAAFRRADELSMAMEARGYRSER